MSAARILWLAVSGVVFAAWAVLAFRTLFELRRRGEARTGRALNGPGTFVAAARDWGRDPAARPGRRALAALTLALIALSLLGPVAA